MGIALDEKIALMEQSLEDKRKLDLIERINLALEAYKQQIDKKRASIDSNTDNKAISAFLEATTTFLDSLKRTLISPDTDDNNPHTQKIALSHLKKHIEDMDQQVKDKCLPTLQAKIYEKIKTLLSDLIRLFAPFEGRQLIHKATQTLSNTRATLFNAVKTMEDSLNPSEKTEQFHYYRSMIAPMFG